MRVRLTYKKRGADEHESFIGAITFNNGSATFKGSQTGMGTRDTFKLTKATLDNIAEVPHDNVMKFKGIMNGWPIDWVAQAVR